MVTDDRIARLRREYEAQGLVEGDMAADPYIQFEEWFSAVVAAGIDEPNAFVLSTAAANGRPSGRAVLMKGFDDKGVVFYTGLGSKKSLEIEANPWAAATFVWTPLHRQVRFEGPVYAVESELADDYFASRPRGSQIAAHASRQSTPIESREELDRRFEILDAEFGEEAVPRPESWGGWRLSADSVEFWQGQPNRFHDRVRYTRDGADWVMERLAP
ncbi:MAG: pyridoxamine 5'-phosphate oxidase [Actinomycetota bacterium]|nr:pyridoxamine 5'-phosphate oxidase [Actinomycetota bacterium]